MAWLNRCVCVLSISFLAVGSAWANFELSPDGVKRLVIQQSRQAEIIMQEAQLGDLEYDQAASIFDWAFTAETSFETTQAEALAGFAQDQSDTTTYGFGVSKRLSTGTDVSLSYQRLDWEAELSSFFDGRISPQQTQDYYIFKMEQSLLQNAFGSADRLRYRAAKLTVEQGDLRELESTESLVVSALELYWNAFVAKQSVEESKLAVQRYVDLEKIVLRKKRLKVVTPGEVERVQAELEQQRQNLEARKTLYAALDDQLKQLLQIKAPGPLTFVIPKNLPELPQLDLPKVDSLRPVKSAELERSKQELNLEKTVSETRNQLSLVASVAGTGIDSESGEAFQEAVGLIKPTYYVGLSYTMPINSHLNKGLRTNAQVQRDVARLRHLETQEQADNQLRDLSRDVVARKKIADSSQKTMQLRQQAAKDVEKAYKQGRIDIRNLTDAYNLYFNAQTSRLRAIGNYYIVRNRFLAAKDELVK